MKRTRKAPAVTGRLLLSGVLLAACGLLLFKRLEPGFVDEL